MKEFNINDYIYIRITEAGWLHLKETVGDDYVRHCIDTYKVVIDGVDWYRLQAHEVFSILPIKTYFRSLYRTTIMIDDESLN